MSTLYCPHCGYDLTGLPENRCPECGEAFDPENLAWDSTKTHSSKILKRLIGFTVGVAIVIVLSALIEKWSKSAPRAVKNLIGISMILLLFSGMATNSWVIAKHINAIRIAHSRDHDERTDWIYLLLVVVPLFLLHLFLFMCAGLLAAITGIIHWDHYGS